MEEAEDALENAEMNFSDIKAELEQLNAVKEEVPEWNSGNQLILDSHFKEYAEQFADDIGAVDRNGKWPHNCIDWDMAAEELKRDYSSIEIEGNTYWYRDC